MPRFCIARRAGLQVARLPEEVRLAVVNAFTRLQADPWTAGMKLGSDLAGLWSVKVGAYRILYTIDGPQARATVVVRAVDHRRAVYRRRRA